MLGNRLLAYIIGPSGAGKTTYALKEFPEQNIIHMDDYAKNEPGKPYFIIFPQQENP